MEDKKNNFLVRVLLHFKLHPTHRKKKRLHKILFFPQVDEDEPLFLSLISDLFPGIQLDNATYEDLQAGVTVQVEMAQLVNHPPWNLKVVQVSEMKCLWVFSPLD